MLFKEIVAVYSESYMRSVSTTRGQNSDLSRLIISAGCSCEPSSSVSIVSGYGLDDRAIEVQSPAEAKGFFLLASVSRPALGPTQPPVQLVPRVLSPELKRGRGVSLTTHPHLVLNVIYHVVLIVTGML
jgi:hypothetical protein